MLLFQVLFMIINILIIGLMVISIVRCAKDKIRRKALYIVMILAGIYLGYSSVAGGGFFIRYGFWIGWRGTNFTVFPGGEFSVFFAIPLGAIIYWSIRKNLIRKATLNGMPAEQGVEQSQVSPYISEFAIKEEDEAQDNHHQDDNSYFNE